MRLLQLPVRDEDGRIPHRAVGEGFWQSRSHPEEAFLLWLPLIKASFLALSKKPLFKPPICGGSKQAVLRQDGFQGQSQKGHRFPAPPFRSALTQSRIPLVLGHQLNNDPEKSSTLTRIILSISETCRNWKLETRNWEH